MCSLREQFDYLGAHRRPQTPLGYFQSKIDNNGVAAVVLACGTGGDADGRERNWRPASVGRFSFVGPTKKKKLRITKWRLLFSVGALLLVLGLSVFRCTDVYSQDELKDVRVGFPFRFLSIDLSRYSPLEFPQIICGPVSPWENSHRVNLPLLLLNVVLIFGFIVFLFGWISRE